MTSLTRYQARFQWVENWSGSKTAPVTILYICKIIDKRHHNVHTHARTHARSVTHARAHARTHARTHARKATTITTAHVKREHGTITYILVNSSPPFTCPPFGVLVNTHACSATQARTKSNINNYSACKAGERHYYASLLIPVRLARLFTCPPFRMPLNCGCILANFPRNRTRVG